MKRLVGTALTVKIPPGDNGVVKRALSMTKPGDVLVVDARGYTECCAGGAGMLVPSITRGLAGVVVDGAWRDVTELQVMDFPIYGKAVCPFSGPKLRPGEINVPVSCGGVVVHPADIICCDQEGCVVVPRLAARMVADSLRDYRTPASLSDWDLERSRRLAKERDQWFEELFRAHGGVYVDWQDDGPTEPSAQDETTVCD
jgi:regulator of RNase E activity RraA